MLAEGVCPLCGADAILTGREHLVCLKCDDEMQGEEAEHAMSEVQD